MTHGWPISAWAWIALAGILAFACCRAIDQAITRGSAVKRYAMQASLAQDYATEKRNATAQLGMAQQIGNE